jgi:hypothetical protein
VNKKIFDDVKMHGTYVKKVSCLFILSIENGSAKSLSYTYEEAIREYAVKNVEKNVL